MFYISKTKAAFNPANTNTPDTFVSKGYDTREEAIAVMKTMPLNRFLCVIGYTFPELGQPTPKQPFGI